ncbi:helix-turn-helix domain-containing protein [Azorhizobium doebereinerae]|uniref:helix-turn-helix domain-containing protein n=1 Tax=Azorhizobium doebereinerae TaxID=281091 RepID=UPI0004083529|nr:AraC family transcriptional regulator [Azorhizobium doebereinerae]
MPLAPPFRRPPAPAEPDPETSALLSARLRRLLDEAGQALEGDMNRARGCIARATALLRQEEASAGAGSGRLAPWQMREVTRFIDAHIARNIAIEELAALARLSPSHFSKRFRARFGLSPYNYVLARRVELAQQMMTGSQDSLSEIALNCGFSDQAHFSRVFKRVTGESPNAWRRLWRAAPPRPRVSATEAAEAARDSGMGR